MCRWRRWSLRSTMIVGILAARWPGDRSRSSARSSDDRPPSPARGPSAAVLMMLVSWRRSGSITTVMPWPSLRRDALAEGDELLERLVLREAVRHPARPAAAEAEDLDPQPRQPRERLRHVGHLLLRRRSGPVSFSVAGRNRLALGVGMPTALTCATAASKSASESAGELGGAELDVVEAGRLRDLDAWHGAQYPTGFCRLCPESDHVDRATRPAATAKTTSLWACICGTTR